MFFISTGGTSRQTWIDLCQKAQTDPHDLTNRHLDKLFSLILGASTVDSKVSSPEFMIHRDLTYLSQYGFADASSSAVGTLAFVSPATVLPRMVDELRADINPSVVNALTETDVGTWLTPEGTAYIDGQLNQSYHFASVTYSMLPSSGTDERRCTACQGQGS